MTQCSDNQQAQIDALAAGELRGVREWATARHAGRCTACAARLRQARALMGGLRAVAKEEGGEMLRERVFAAMGAPADGVPTASRRRARVRLAVQLGGAAITCAIVAAILFPVFSQAREKARSAKAVSHLQQLAVGTNTRQDYDEYYSNDSPVARGGQNGGGLTIDGPQGRVAGSYVGKDEGRPTTLRPLSQSRAFASNTPPPPRALFANPAQTPPARTQLNTFNGVTRDGEATVEPDAKPVNPFQATATPDRYLVRNANLVIEVKDARAAHDKLSASVKAERGYLSNLQELVDNLGVRTITMQVRVPAKQFEGSMSALTGLGKVMDKKVTAEDVTEDYVDTDSTLRNQKRTEERLLSHLSRTGKLSDTLLVEKELTRVREEIEQHEGHLKFLAHRIQYSTIDVTLTEAAKARPAVPPASYSTAKEATDASRSLFEFLRAVWSTVIWIGIWAVVWAPLTLVGLFVVRKVWRAWVNTGANP